MSPIKMGKSAWSHVTPYLIFCCVGFSFGDLLFGIDTGSFGSLQVLPSWLSQFGDYNPTTKVYSSPTSRVSIMNSVPFAGKLVGTMLFEPIAERVGYKKTMYLVAFVQCIALIVELTAKNWVVFTVGRVIAYLGVGLVENAVPSYISELSPAGIRGFMSGSLTVLVSAGNLWGTGMSRAFQNHSGKEGWIVPVAIQFIPALGILVVVPFAVESPRWLISKGRNDEALKCLDRVRHPEEVDAGFTTFEIDAISRAVEESRSRKEGRWTDLYRGTYLRRSIILALLFWFYQSTGVQFVNTYGPTFYTQIGQKAKAFTYTAIGNGVGIIATVIAIVVTDKIGRRPPVIVGGILTTLFNFLIAGLGTKKNPSKATANTVIASIILVLSAGKMFQTTSFLMASEIGGVMMRKKFMGFGTTVDVISAFIFTFCLPYLLKTPGANLGPKVGYLIGGNCVFSLIFGVFFVPELANRSLEEMDELFDLRLWAWQFKGAQTSGVGAQITQAEAGRAVTLGKQADVEEGHGTSDEKGTDERIERI